MRENTCCFTGHRQIPREDAERLYYSVREKINCMAKNKITNFICGGAIGFDMLCGIAVLEEKKTNSDIKLILALPCREQAKYFNVKDTERYNKLLSSADKIIYTSETYFNGCMHKRNRFMVDNSAFLISYCTKSNGGSFYTRKYAISQNLQVIDIL